MKKRNGRKAALVLVLIMMTSGMTFAGNGSFQNFKRNRGMEARTFTDITTVQAEMLKPCYEMGLMNGKGNGKFDPKGNLKICEALSMAAKYVDIFNGGSGIIPESGTHWYDGTVAYALEKGIVDADDFSNYTKTATRGEMAYIFYNAMKLTECKEINDIENIPDVSVAEKYNEAIFGLYNTGIVTGKDKAGNYRPTANIVRSEAAVIMTRVADPAKRSKFELLSEKTYPSKDGIFTVRAGKNWTEAKKYKEFNILEIENLATESTLIASAVEKSTVPGVSLNVYAMMLQEVLEGELTEKFQVISAKDVMVDGHQAKTKEYRAVVKKEGVEALYCKVTIVETEQYYLLLMATDVEKTIEEAAEKQEVQNVLNTIDVLK